MVVPSRVDSAGQYPVAVRLLSVSRHARLQLLLSSKSFFDTAAGLLDNVMVGKKHRALYLGNGIYETSLTPLFS